jgi:type 1 glutamine amidotransferase
MVMVGVAGSLLLAAAGAAQAEKAPKPLRLLILTGRNNHDWKATTPALKKTYEDSGRFTVDVTTEPERCDAATFARYDVVVSNWSNWPNTKNRDWGKETEKAFLDFVRSGKGFVVFHAAAATFHAWPEFQQLVGSTWKLGQTGHGRYHEFKVTITDGKHPITRGMKDFTTTDEFWHRVGVTGELNVLCTAFADKKMGGTGADEPAAHWRTFGKGRCFHLILGHDPRALTTPGTKALMLRGTEWAATGEVTIPLPAQLRAEGAASGEQ